MKKNKGFTLVELLGVIILLGVIAIIITPNILKLEKKSEKELFEDSVNALIRGAQMYYANNDFINYPTNGIAANSEELNVKNILYISDTENISKVANISKNKHAGFLS